jgi:hypothetical protein
VSNSAIVARDATVQLKGNSMKSYIFGLALLSAIVASAPAQAQNGSLTRSFVSSAGVDTNPCTVTQPCATFAHAYTAIAANGIIAALDPGKYGPLNIIGSVTVDGNGWASITATANGYGISINAGSNDVVTLKGLAIEGVGAANYGVWFNTGNILNVLDCSIKNTLIDGIYVGAALNSAELFVSNTFISHINSSQTSAAIYFLNESQIQSTATLDHVTITDSSYGVWVLAETAPIQAMTTDSEIATTVFAFWIQGTSTATADAVFKNDKLSSVGTGFYADGYTKIYLSQIVQTGDSGFGILAKAAVPNAIFSDNTNHLGTIGPTVSDWATQ